VTGAGHGDARAAYDAVESLYLPIGLAVFVVVLATMAWLVVRNRARPGRTARPTGEHRAFELGVAALIAAIGALLLTVTFRHDDRTQAAASARPTLRVDVTSFRWGWSFRYPDLGGVVTRAATPGVPAILRVPAGATVRFGLDTRDVIHSFWLPELRFKRDLFPNRHDQFDLRFPRETAFLGGHCAEYCGLGHADMNFAVVVLAPREFDAWIAQHRRRPG
jgi:cytochrome c oxidase subunit 2